MAPGDTGKTAGTELRKLRIYSLSALNMERLDWGGCWGGGPPPPPMTPKVGGCEEEVGGGMWPGESLIFISSCF